MHRNLGLGSWIARRARMAPDRIALVFGERSFTYRQLDQRITRLARALSQRGVGEGDRVAFLGPNDPAALETLFACGLLGAVAVPVHPGFDDRSLIRVLKTAEPVALIVTPDLLARVRRIRHAIEVPQRFTTGLVADGAERYEDLIEAGSDEPIDRPIGLDQLCLLAFSSGTTGPSKGVGLTHGNLLFNAVNVLSCLDYLRDDVLLGSAPLYRMGGLGFSLALLLKGGTCVLQEREGPEVSLQLIERHRVTILFDAVPALEALRSAPRFSSTDLSSLRICVSGGSYVPPQLVDAFRQRGLFLQPGYGLTEAAPLALLVDRDEVEAHPGAAGRPPLFCSVRVVDDDLEDVAAGEIGELLVAGPNVMSGYFRAPRATARALVDGWLRTGDAARAGEGGMIAVIGRVSEALVLSGKRVYPQPIEAQLRAHGGVLDCALAQRAPESSPVLFLVLCEGQAIDRDRLLSLCRDRLGATAPELRVVSALPRNANGKLLRSSLRALLHSMGPSAPSRRHGLQDIA